jgi:hypothetical protein
LAVEEVMMAIALRTIVLCGLVLGGCAQVNNFVMGPIRGDDQGSLVTGFYHRTPLSGDLFDYNCSYGHLCRTVLIRDDYLRNHFVDLDGRKLVLRVERTSACHDPRSSQFACRSSPDGTAFVILQWVRPEV